MTYDTEVFVIWHVPGGFNKFQTEYPEHCETNLDCSCPSSSPPSSVLGLGGLRISSDCSDGESDREPGSATESEGSPLPSNQPAFPVQILPYLYLGCAKDSTNLDVLGKYNIKYILNVTPNLPNMFEHDGEFKYKQIPISDHWSQNLSQFFPEAISFIGKFSRLLDFQNFKAHVHQIIVYSTPNSKLLTSALFLEFILLWTEVHCQGSDGSDLHR